MSILTDDLENLNFFQDSYLVNNDETQQDYESDFSLFDDFELEEKKKYKIKKPNDNAFLQQKLNAFIPIYIPQKLIFHLFILASILLSIEVLIWYSSSNISEIIINYTNCELNANNNYWSDIPKNQIISSFIGKKNRNIFAVWKYEKVHDKDSNDQQSVCRLQFRSPEDLKPPIFFFYILEGFHANHRRYVQSFSKLQLSGHSASIEEITRGNQNCDPLSFDKNKKIIYPCGLIANSMFNDTFSESLKAVNNTKKDYQMSTKNVSWKYNKLRFKKTNYHHSQIVPPPNWIKKFPNGYNENNVPDISTWYHFQNWMMPSAFPKFSKLLYKNSETFLNKGSYQIDINLNFPVLPYNGKKYIYISQNSKLGGGNKFFYIFPMVLGVIFFLLSVIFLVIIIIKPRILGDSKKLTWNKDSEFQ